VKTVFADTSGFYAFLDGTDPFHDGLRPRPFGCFLGASRRIPAAGCRGGARSGRDHHGVGGLETRTALERLASPARDLRPDSYAAPGRRRELYDPSQFNDKTLLGLKGNVSETELQYLRMRLQGGLQSKASRGELRLRLPVGFVYDARGRVVLTPEKDVQESIRLLFKTFERVGPPHAVMRYFRDQGLKFLMRLHSGPSKGETVWRPPLRNRVEEVLRNPRYAGAFAYGRRTQQGVTANGKQVVERLPQEKWQPFLPGIHQGYISFDVYEKNQRQLAENSGRKRWRHPAREGPALLQGLAVCGRCGSRMNVRYHFRRGKVNPDYVCQGPLWRTACARSRCCRGRRSRRSCCCSRPSPRISARSSGTASATRSPSPTTPGRTTTPRRSRRSP
jgi:hypothetical protein